MFHILANPKRRRSPPWHLTRDFKQYFESKTFDWATILWRFEWGEHVPQGKLRVIWSVPGSSGMARRKGKPFRVSLSLREAGRCGAQCPGCEKRVRPESARFRHSFYGLAFGGHPDCRSHTIPDVEGAGCGEDHNQDPGKRVPGKGPGESHEGACRIQNV